VPPLMRFVIVVGVGSVAFGTTREGATAQTPISNAREVRDALRVCWLASESGATAQVSVRLGFNRDGGVIGQPLITYENPKASEEDRAAIRDTLAKALGRCVPLHLSDAFRKVIPVHPITVRFGEGWPRRGHTLPSGSKQ
jgi:hypothetical protein